MALIKLALRSAWNRKISLLLAIFTIAISILLLLGVDSIRKQAKQSFMNSVTDTDLIVGARGGDVNLLLYSIFHLGDASNNISYKSYTEIIARPEVKWNIPISLGDSHRGYRVVGTNQDFFKYYQYADGQTLNWRQGQQFTDIYDAVIGYEVARALNYQIGQNIIIAHGLVATKFALHEDKPFKIAGILQPTNTPVDRSIFVSLEGIEAIHIDWQGGTRSLQQISAEQARNLDLQPQTITAFMLGLERKTDIFRLQRYINQYPNEALIAILPGVTLTKLWHGLGNFEQILWLISSLVFLVAFSTLLASLLSTLNERRREMAILRAVGARSYHILLLFVLEATLIVITACVLGLILLYGVAYNLFAPILLQLYGLQLNIPVLDITQAIILIIALGLGILLGLIPGFIAYRWSLQDGLRIRT
jgi:putative ABC transport system permease protein